MSAIAADLVLVVHFAFVLFVVGGLALTWIGAMLGWSIVRSYAFRAAHLVAICFVAGEALAGIACPLTLWEDALRGSTTHTSFVARWVHQLMFFSLPEWVFTLIYLAFAGIVVLTFWLVPPRRRSTAKTH